MSLTYTTSNTFQTFVPPQVIYDFNKSKKTVCWQASRSEAFWCKVGSSAAELLKHCAKHTHLIPGGPWKKNMFQCWLHRSLWKAYLICRFAFYHRKYPNLHSEQLLHWLSSSNSEHVTSTPATQELRIKEVNQLKLLSCLVAMEPSFLSKHDKVNSPFFHDFQDISRHCKQGFYRNLLRHPNWRHAYLTNWSTCIQETTQDAAQDLSDLGVDDLGRFQNL